jgi:glutamine synthetase
MTDRQLSTPSDVEKWLAQNGVRSVRVEWCDLNGLGRGKLIPAERFAEVCRDGVQLSNAALTFDILSIPATAAGLGADTGYGNVRAVPDVETLRAWPTDSNVAWCLCSLENLDGEVVAVSPHSFADRIGARLAAMGLHARIAPEFEFYVMGADGEPLESGYPCYGTETLHRCEAALQTALVAVGAFWTLEAWHHEHGPGQFEINVKHAAYREALVGLHGARIAVRESIARMGLRASFMAKPYNGFNGSACQLNVSLQEDAGGGNLFAHPTNPTEPSQLCRHFVGGVLAHLDEITAVLLPNGNSYRRVVPGHFAPITKAWAIDNRTAAVRVVTQSRESARVELRVPGADICAHLAIPAVLAAGLDGVERKLDPSPSAEGDLDRSDMPRIVTDWATALDLFARSAWVRSTFGQDLASAFLSVKRQEFARFSSWVSDFDRRDYGQHL